MKVKELFDYIDSNNGDMTAININDNVKKVILNGIAGSKDCFYDNIVDLPKGKYILVRAIETITIE